LAPPPSPREPAIYVVQPGDTLFAIARANGLSVDQIAALNGLPDPDVIQVGQVLTLPGGEALSAPLSQRERESSAYTVQPGDTLFSIAARYDVPMASIVAWNGLSDPHHIVAGVTLK